MQHNIPWRRYASEVAQMHEFLTVCVCVCVCVCVYVGGFRNARNSCIFCFVKPTPEKWCEFEISPVKFGVVGDGDVSTKLV